MVTRKIVPVTLALVALIAIIGALPAHASTTTVWTLSLDANSISAADASPQTSGTFAKTFSIGAIINASGTLGACASTCLRGVFGWQFSIVYDKTSFVPQADPVALSPSDVAGTTVVYGAQSSPGNPNWAGLVTGNNGFTSSVVLPVDATHDKIEVFFALIGVPAVDLFPAVTTSVKGNLLARVTFEVINKPASDAQFSLDDVILVDHNATQLPNITTGSPITETITNNPPVANFALTHLVAGDPSCTPLTGLKCTGYAVKADGTASSDLEASIANPSGYFWDWGDGTQDNVNSVGICPFTICNQGSIAIHDYGLPGTYDVTLRVVDDLGATGSARDPSDHVIVNSQPSHASQVTTLAPILPLAATVDCGSAQTVGKPFNCLVTATGGTPPYTGDGTFSRTETTKGTFTESFTVTDSAGGTATGQATITVSGQPVAVTVTCPSTGVTAGKPFSCTVDASGGTAPYVGTGSFSLTEATKGAKIESFTVTDANGVSASGTATVEVGSQPLVVTVTCPTSGLTTGKPFSCDVSATGGTTPYSGVGPQTVTESVKGTFTESFTVTDANGASAVGSASVTITGQPLVVNVTCPTSGLTAGKPSTCDVTTSGGTAPFVGTGPQAVTEATKGTFLESFTVTDGNGQSATGTATVRIDAQPLIVTVTCPTSGVTAGKPFDCTVEASGGTAPYAGTGVFSRTEDLKGLKVESFTVVDSNTVGAVGSATITVEPQPLVVTATCPSSGVTAAKPFTCNVSATGGTQPYAGTGTIARTEAIKGAATESFTVTDANGASTTITVTVDVAPQPLVVAVSCPANVNAGEAFVCTVTATGGTGPYQGTGSFSITEPVKGSFTESFTVTDANGISASASATLAVAGPPPIVVVTCPSSGITSGKPFDCAVEASGGTAPYSGTGTFSVTEPTKGTKVESFTVTDANGASATGTASVTVNGQPLVVTVSCQDTGVTEGKPFSCTVSATGGTGPYQGTGTFTMVEPAKGTYTESFSVTDANGAAATGSASVTVAPQPLVVTVTCQSTGGFTAGKPFSCSVSATGGTEPYSGTGAFTLGEPVKGTFTESFSVTDANGVTASGSAIVNVAPQPLIVTVTCSTGTTGGKPFTCTVSATGGTQPYSGTGAFSVMQPVKGTFTETFSVTDANGVTATGSAIVTIVPQPLVVTVTCGLVANAITAGKPFDCVVSAAGGTQPYAGTGSFTVTEPAKGVFTESFSVTDANGVSASANTLVTISGQPLVVSVSCPTIGITAGKPFSCTVDASGGTAPYTGTGSFSLTEAAKGSAIESFEVTDSNGVTGSATATINVEPQPLTVIVTCPSSGTVGTSFDCNVEASGGTAPYGGTGTQTITESVKGLFTESFTITDANGQTASGSALVNVAGTPLVTTVTCPGTAAVGVAFDCSVGATGGTAPYSGTGTFTITETVKGSKAESFTVTDSNGVSATASATLVVTAQPLVVTLSCPSAAQAGVAFTCNVSATGGTAPYSGTGNFEITEPVKGSKIESFTVTDANSVSAAGTATVTISPLSLSPSFTVSPDATAGQPVTFTASATGGTMPYSSSWNFGDGGTGAGSPVTHTFPSTGQIYWNVTLTMSDANNATAYSTQQIRLIFIAPPQASFTESASSVPTGTLINFDASGSTSGATITNYAWDFGDSSTGTSASISHSYSIAGNYTVTLTIMDSNGLTASATAVKVIIDRPPTAAFKFTPNSPFTSQNINFDASASSDPDGSTVAFAWDFGDGTTGSGVTTSHVYVASQTFTVKLTVTDNSGNKGVSTKSITTTPFNFRGAHASLAKWSAAPGIRHQSLSSNPTNTLQAYGVNDGSRTVWAYVQFQIVSDNGATFNIYTQVVQLSPSLEINGKTDATFSAVFTPSGAGTFTVIATIFYSANPLAPPIGDAAFNPDLASAKAFSFQVVP